LSAMLFTLCAMPLSVANAKTVTLGWDSNDEPDLDGYVIYRNTNTPGPPYSYSDAVPEDELADPLHPQAKLTGLQEGEEYYIALTAYNTEGVESSFSNDICVEVVNAAIELCSASASTPIAASSSGGSGGGSAGCFISAASHGQSDKNLLPYILFTITAIGIGAYGYKKKVLNSAID
jgi:chitinase